MMVVIFLLGNQHMHSHCLILYRKVYPRQSLVDFHCYIARRVLETNRTRAYSLNNNRVQGNPTREFHLSSQAHLLDEDPRNTARRCAICGPKKTINYSTICKMHLHVACI